MAIIIAIPMIIKIFQNILIPFYFINIKGQLPLNCPNYYVYYHTIIDNNNNNPSDGSRFLLVWVAGFEPVPPVWKTGMLAVEHHTHIYGESYYFLL